MIIVISPAVKSLMVFIIFRQLEQINVELTGLAQLVVTVRKVTLYHLILLNV